MRDRRTSVPGRVALGAVVLALLVVPVRSRATEHAMDHELVPYAGAVHARATTGEPREIDAQVVAADAARRGTEHAGSALLLTVA